MPRSARIILAMVCGVYLAGFALASMGCQVPLRLYSKAKGKEADVKEPITERNYYLYLPAGYNPAQKYPLVVSIHGMKPWDNAYPQLLSWKKLCDDNGWICIAPQLKSPDMLNQFPFRRIDSSLLDDEAQIVASIKDVSAKYNVDSRYIMLTGWSSGGYLIHYIGARYPELFTVIAPGGADFSADIMPETVTDAARQTPILIFHGKYDVGIVVRESNEAVQWYYRNGYTSVQMGEAPGGHERHPELAANFFIGHISGTNAYSLASRSLEARKQVARGPGWLDESGQQGPGVQVVSAGPAPAAVARPPADLPIASPDTRLTAPPPGIPVAAVPTPPSKYVWDKIGPARRPDTGAGAVTTAAPGPTPVPPVSPAPDATGGARVGVVSEQPSAIRPAPTITAMPIGPSPVASLPGGRPPLSRPRPNNPIDSGLDGRPLTGSPKITALPTATVGPGELDVSRLATAPGSRARNPVSEVTPAIAATPPTGAASGTPPQIVPVSPNRTGVRIVPSTTEGAGPLTVEFRAEVRNLGAKVVRYNWRLADILFGTSHFAVLTFRKAGRYPIEVTIVDAAGNSYRDQVIVRVFESE